MWLWKKKIKIEIGAGEALDRLSILWIKTQKLNSEKRPKVVEQCKKLHLDLLNGGVHPTMSEDLFDHYGRLIAVNRHLWEVEDKIRDACAREDKEECLKLAQEVHKLNARRSALKAEADILYDGNIREVKSYRGE